MKSKIFMLFILGASMVLSACNAETGTQNHDFGKQENISLDKKDNRSRKDIQGSDKTVSAVNSIHLDQYQYTEEIISQNDYAVSADLSDMAKAAEEVVEGKILSVEYVSVDGDAWTKVDLEVMKSLEGSLVQKDKITVYQSGGYVPLKAHIASYDDAFRYKDWNKKKINATILHETVDGEEAPVVGTQSIYYLIPMEKKGFPKGIYGRVCGKYAQLSKIGKKTYRHFKMDGKEKSEEVTISNIQKEL